MTAKEIREKATRELTGCAFMAGATAYLTVRCCLKGDAIMAVCLGAITLLEIILSGKCAKVIESARLIERMEKLLWEDDEDNAES